MSINFYFEEDIDLSEIAARIEYLAEAGARLAIDSDAGPHTGAVQGLFEMIDDLAGPMYEVLIRMKDVQK